MIHGAHVIVFSSDADADRDFLGKVLSFPSVDAGGGWLIFALPPAEVAVHPGSNDVHQLYFMCDDVHAFIDAMKAKKVACTPVEEQRWGSITKVTLPGGGAIGVYQPKHRTAIKRAAVKKKTTKATGKGKKTRAKRRPRGVRGPPMPSRP
jgi:hypothetical protein